MRKERFLSVAIDPSCNGTSEIFIRAYNDVYPHKWKIRVFAPNPVEAAEKIIEQIEKIQAKVSWKEFFLKEVIVKLPNENAKNNQQIINQWQLIGILRFHYQGKFRGHQLVQTEQLNSKNFKSDIEKVMYLHFQEKEKH